MLPQCLQRLHCQLAVVSVDDLHVLQETIPDIFTQQGFNSWAALGFNASGLMDNKLAEAACDRVVSGNYSVHKTR